MFNQSKDLWLGLEDHVLAVRRRDRSAGVGVHRRRCSSATDPPYRGILIPRRFWKVAAWTEPAEDGDAVLAAAGFVLDQTELIDPTHHRRRPAGLVPHVPGADRRHRALADIDFGALVSADVMPVSAARETAWTELTRLADVRL